MTLTASKPIAASLTIEDYLAAIGISVTRRFNKNVWQYSCPLHTEHTPSFVIYRNKQRWRCYGSCHEGGSLVHLIHLREGIPYWQAYDLAGRPRENREGKESEDDQEAIKKKTPYASREERHLMSLAMQWWHRRLFDPSVQAGYARHYLLRRGVTHASMNTLPQIGFAPRDPDGSYSSAFRSFLSRYAQMGDWEEIALHVGLLSLKNPQRMRYQGRVTFCCTFPRQGWQEVWYIQGRTLYSDDTCKYLGASSIKKVPFTLPLAFVDLPATVVVESPIGPAVLAGYGIPTMATLGEGLDMGFLDQFPTPLFLCQDNDEPKALKGKDGEIKGYTQPGEMQAIACLKECQAHRIPAYRVEPPRVTKGVDEWIMQYGSTDPLFTAIERVLAEKNMPLPNKWRVSVY